MSATKRRREFEAFLAELCEDCTIEDRSTGHFMVKITGPLGKRLVTVGGTPSDGRAMKNAKAHCKRAAREVGLIAA